MCEMETWSLTDSAHCLQQTQAAYFSSSQTPRNCNTSGKCILRRATTMAREEWEREKKKNTTWHNIRPGWMGLLSLFKKGEHRWVCACVCVWRSCHEWAANIPGMLMLGFKTVAAPSTSPLVTGAINDDENSTKSSLVPLMHSFKT